MPLNKACSLEALRENIATEIRAGKPREQAVAIAHDTLRAACKEAGQQVPKTDHADAGCHVMRFDRGEFKAPVETPNGYLRCDASITRTGVFEYRQPDGSTFAELRLPDEVFRDDALGSFDLVPLTNGHPTERLTPKNTRKYSAGMVQGIRRVDNIVGAEVLVTDEQAIQDVKDGKTALSCGYHCDLDYTPGITRGIPGVPDGIHYDAIQRNICGNHVAIVNKGRAGPDVGLHLDSQDAVQTEAVTPTGPEPGPVGGNNMADEKMKTLTIDGVDYELPKTAADHLGRHFDNLLKHSKDLEGQVKELQARADAADEALAAEREKTAPEAIRAIVSRRVALETTAAKILKKDELRLDEMTEADIHRAVVLHVSPGAKDRLDDADEGYLAARFDAAVEAWEEEQKNKPTASDRVKQAVRMDGGDMRLDAASARKRMLENHRKLGTEPIRPTDPNRALA